MLKRQIYFYIVIFTEPITRRESVTRVRAKDLFVVATPFLCTQRGIYLLRKNFYQTVLHQQKHKI